MKNQNFRQSTSYLILPLFLMVFLTLSCGQLSQSQPDDPSAVTPDLLKDELEFDILVNSSQDGSNATAGVVRNQSDRLYSFHTIIEYTDASGKLLGTHPSAIFDLYPGTEQAFFALTADDWSHAANVDVKVTNIIKDEATEITPDFEFTNLSVFQYEHGKRIFGEVTNHDEMQYSIIVLGIAYDNDQDATMGNISGIDNLRPGETRLFTVNLLGEHAQATTAQVYLDSITDVTEVSGSPALMVSNISAVYDPERDRTSIQYDLVNRDQNAYSFVKLLIGAYDQGRLLQINDDVVFSIGPEETVSADRSLMDGNFEGYEIKIQVNAFEAVPQQP